MLLRADWDSFLRLGLEKVVVGLIFPAIDPIAVQVGPVAIRWYALAYVVGLIGGWGYVRYLVQTHRIRLNTEMVDDLLVWIMVGVVVGGRFGYVLFYQFSYFVENPLAIFAVWRGGMSFHGGLIGVVSALGLFAYRRRVNILSVTDAVAPAFPFGLMLGRVSNFINGELYGRAAEVPWAIVFPHGGDVARHPSQLYEAALEGVLLLGIMLFLVHAGSAHRRPGLLSGTFLLGYAVARIISETFREPDYHIGFIWSHFTMGQLLSMPLALMGIWLIVRSKRSG